MKITRDFCLNPLVFTIVAAAVITAAENLEKSTRERGQQGRPTKKKPTVILLMLNSPPQTKHYRLQLTMNSLRKPPAPRIPSLFRHHTASSSFKHTTDMAKTNEDDKSSSREHGLISLFKNCSSTRDLARIHAQIFKTGFTQHVYVAGRLISFCSVSEQASMDYAASLFQEIQHPDGFLYNTMIRGFGRCNRAEEAFSMYRRMRSRGKAADNFTFCFLLKICAASMAVELGMQVHCGVLKHGLDSQVFVCNALVHMYAVFRDMVNACKVFEEMPDVDLVSWNTLLNGYVQCCRYKEAQDVFIRMKRCGFSADEATLVVVLSACSETGSLDYGRWVHSGIERSVLDQSVSVSNSLVDMYAKCGAVDRAMQVFADMRERNTVSWNSMILGLAMHGSSQDALRLFAEMLECDEPYTEPNDITFLGVLCACRHRGLIDKGMQYFNVMTRDYGINPNIRHFGCMVDLLGRAGQVREAYELIQSMPMESNAVVWRTLLGACRLHGNLELGEVAKKELTRVEPDHSSDYVLLSHMYASKDQWSDVLGLRDSMQGRGVQKPEPGNCFIDILPDVT